MRRFRLHWSGVAAASLIAAAALLAADRETAPSQPMLAGSATHHLGPVEYFRGLLGMTPAQRARELARRPAADRALILAKIQEYEALPKDIREARLCQTELHWELSNLMRLPPAGRGAQLRQVSPLYQPMLLGLLREWDEVPAATQKALLERQNFIGVYLRMQGSPAAAQQEILDKLPAERRAHWAEEMDRWQRLPEEQRADLCAQFQRFCQMSAPDRQETVHELSPAEQREMEETLQAFDRLPPQQRTLCIGSFRKFATMAPAERAQFLKNAARWDAMTSDERQLWRDLVHTLPPMPPPPPNMLPPMPPGFPPSGPRLPPMPPWPPSVTAPVVVARSSATK